jgi:hypothetical protein
MSNILTSREAVAGLVSRAKNLSNKAVQAAKRAKLEARDQWRAVHGPIVARTKGQGARHKVKLDELKHFSRWQAEQAKLDKYGINGLRKELQPLLEQARESLCYIKNPKVHLQNHGIGTERRSRLWAEVSPMGPASLAQLAIKAKADNDKDLASVVMVANDLLPKESRQFSSQDFAVSFVGKSVDSMLNQLDNVEYLMTAASIGLDDAQGKSVGTKLIGLGVARFASQGKDPTGKSVRTIEPDSEIETMREAWNHVRCIDPTAPDAPPAKEAA